MEYRALGQTGLTVSALGFGCGNVGGLMIRGDPSERRANVQRALEAGITYFDTAPSYGNGRSEENLGQTLRELNAWGRVVVGTKLRVSADEDVGQAVRASVEASLRRLGQESVDLVQLHNPIGALGGRAGALPAEVVREEVAAAMKALVDAGLVRHIGITGIGMTEALKEVITSRRFETMQSYFNALNPSAGFGGAAGGGLDFDGVIDDAAAAEMGVIGIRVMAAGAMSASAERAPLASPGGGALVPGGEFAADIERARRLIPLGEELGLESTQELGFRFVLAKPGISTALIGFSDRKQLEDALRWTERGPLPEEAVERIVGAARRK